MENHPFILFSYTREQAIADGVLVDLMQDEMAPVCRQHYKYPVACTSAVFDIIRRAVENPRWSNDYAGVVHDILWMSRVASRALNPSTVVFRVTITGAGIRQLYDFKLIVGPGDQAEPVITIMMPEED